MVASELPAVPQLNVSAAAPGAAPSVSDAPANDSTEFNTLLAQLLEPAAAVVVAGSTVATTGELKKNIDDGSDDPATALDAEAILLQGVAVPPTVVDLAQAIRSATAIPAGTGETPVAGNTAAIVANAQLQASAGQIRAGGADGQESKLLQLGQGLPLQALADSAANTAGLSSDTQDNRDKSSKQDNGLNNNTLLGVGLQSDARSELRTELQVQARVGTPAWRDEVGAKLTWMIDRGVQHGTLRLSPENLGPMEVRITTQNDQVSVWFGAAHADTRAALENALPRLREMFSAQGLSLSDAGVFREPPRESPQDAPRGYASQRTEIQGIAAVGEHMVTIGRRDGLLDAYA
jgi:flagellar hook-length control protein FliK